MVLAKRASIFLLMLTGPVAAGAALGQQPETGKVGENEEKVLKAAGIAIDNEGLLNYLKLRSLKDADRPVLEKLIKDLDSNSFSVRDKASKELVARGKLALKFLKEAARDGPLEVVMRAKECIQKIEKAAAAEQASVVARLLSLRGAPGAIEALFNYLPVADDDTVAEEVLLSLGRLTVHGDKVDPLLMAALKDQHADRRAAAAYILGLCCNMTHRDVVRQMLGDPSPTVQMHAAAGLVGKRLAQSNQDSTSADLGTLKTHKVGSDPASLAEFLQKRTLSATTQKKIKGLIVHLGDTAWSTREKATKALIAEDVPALPFLKTALDSQDAETATRARICIQAIKTKSSPVVPAAVARLLARSGDPLALKEAKDDPRALKPGQAIEVLLAYVPFADDEAVEEEVLNALTILSVRQAKIEPALVAALGDALPARRGIAAAVLGKVGLLEHLEPIRKLLKDKVPRVQFRAAQGLLAAQDREAVLALIDLIQTAPDAWVWQVDEQLGRVAAGNTPTVPPSENLADYRKKAHAAWSGWWKTNAAKVDLAGLGRTDALLGLFTIVEYDSFMGNRQGKVWECGRDGKPRWKVANLFGAMDGRLLPSGNVLVVENSVQKVTERDVNGKELWAYQTPGPPIAVEKLANGNLFVAMYDRVMELTPDKKQVYNTMRGPQMFMYHAQRLKDGNVAAITAQGQIVIFDPVANRDVKVINLGQPNGWCGLEVLPNGRYLVALMSTNQVREVDAAGKVLWQINYAGVFRATRLPNGNTVVCSMTTRKVAELDRNGIVVWEITCDGRPWNVHFR